MKDRLSRKTVRSLSGAIRKLKAVSRQGYRFFVGLCAREWVVG